MPPPLSLAQWHSRFNQQADWTRDIRRYLYAKARLTSSRRILDVGCGTGALLPELVSQSSGEVFGLDLSAAHLRMAMRSSQMAHLIQGDAHQLPFPSHTFDMALCHFVLLWVSHPTQVICEMRRLVRPGGAVLALAEPDYGGRIDHPGELARLGELQRNALRHQGANPEMGRKLAGIFLAAGLQEVESGVLGGQWTRPPSREEWESEWSVLEADLGYLPDQHFDLEALKSQDWEAWQRGERILYVPTFYAWGKVSD